MASRPATSSGLRWCFVSHRFFSQVCNVIVGAHEHDLRSIEHTADEGARLRQLFGAIDRRIDLSPEAILNRSKCREQVRQLYTSDYHEIDVAGRRVLPSGDRTIDEGDADFRLPRQLREPCS